MLYLPEKAVCAILTTFSNPAKSLTMKLSACSSMERAERELHPACPDRSCRCRRARRLGRGRQCRAGPRRQRLCAGIPGVADSLRCPHPQHFRGRRRNPGTSHRPAAARRVELSRVRRNNIGARHQARRFADSDVPNNPFGRAAIQQLGDVGLGPACGLMHRNIITAKGRRLAARRRMISSDGERRFVAPRVPC